MLKANAMCVHDGVEGVPCQLPRRCRRPQAQQMCTCGFCDSHRSPECKRSLICTCTPAGRQGGRGQTRPGGRTGGQALGTGQCDNAVILCNDLPPRVWAAAHVGPCFGRLVELCHVTHAQAARAAVAQHVFCHAWSCVADMMRRCRRGRRRRRRLPSVGTATILW